MELESPNPTQQRRPISGRAASLYYAGLRIAREQNHQRLREEANLPKNIERSLQLQRDRRQSRRTRGPLSRLPNPVAKARSFLADPVTRFWLVCNVCTLITLFSSFFLFMTFLYPSLLRPVLKY